MRKKNIIDTNKTETFPNISPLLPSETASLENFGDVGYQEQMFREELLQLANEGRYEAYLGKLYEDKTDDENGIAYQARFLHTVLHCENPVQVLEHLSHYVYDENAAHAITYNKYIPLIYDEVFLSRAIHLAIDTDNVSLLKWIVSHCLFQERNCQILLDRAVLRLSQKSIEYLLTLDETLTITPPIFFVMVQKNTGNPLLDQCVSLLAQHFLKNPSGEEAPYPWLQIEMLWEMADYTLESLPTFRAYCLEFLLLTPFMKFALQENLMSKDTRNDMIQILQSNIFNLMKNCNSFRKNISIVIPKGEENQATPLEFTIAPHIYQDSVDLLEVLLTKYPRTKQRKAIRCLVAALALLDDPAPTMVERVKNMKGTHLEITQLELPWFEKQENQNESLISQNLFKNWEKVMPKQLKLAITYDTEIHCPVFGDHFVDLELWLPHVDVLGKPPEYTLSQIAQELLTYPCDHPLFLQALAPEGLLFQEKKNLLTQLHQNQFEHRGHYLVTLSLLKEEKSYAL